jgi:hypothetical protein
MSGKKYVPDGVWLTCSCGENLNENLTKARGALTKADAPGWLLNGVDMMAWNAQLGVGMVEGIVNAVVGMGTVAGEVAETAAEIAFTAGAAIVAKTGGKVIREVVEKGAKEVGDRAVRVVSNDGIQKCLPKMITKEQVPYDKLGKEAPCFLPGTLISTVCGLNPIELVEERDKVIVFDFETRTFA